MRRITRQVLIGTAAAAVLIGLASPANAALTVRALWNMDSLPTMVDSAGGDNNGKTSNVTTSQGYYSFNGTSSSVSVPDKANLDPGAANVRVSAKVSITNVPRTGQTFDVVRKGVKYTAGGYYKMEIIRSADGKAVAACRFKDGDGGGAANAYGTVNLAGKGFVTITCNKTATGISVSAGGQTTTVAKRLGSISNSASLAVASKGDGTDWFPGLMDFVKIEIG